MAANTPMDTKEAMQALMAPRSIAVVGATERADASSSFVMKNLMRFGYQDGLFRFIRRRKRFSVFAPRLRFLHLIRLPMWR
jgi:hypothetical protein